jgi:hypothetical protein
MKNRFVYILLVLAVFSCKKTPVTETRSFYMGVTPWPSDFTVAAVDEAYSFINNQCDLVSHHFDEGVPYEEAYKHLDWPQELVNDVATRKQKTAPGKKILLSVAALNLTRHEKADYYKNPDGITDSIKNMWKQLPMDDSKMVTAYFNYISYLIDQLHPDWVNYGVESNDAKWNPSDFSAYKNFLAQLYPALKTKYPGLKFFISFMVSDEPGSLSNASQLISLTDFIGLSAYPYVSSSTVTAGNSDPKNLSSNFFTRYLDLSPAKPWCFAETGYIAQDLKIPSLSVDLPGTPQWQADYLTLVMNLCNDRHAEFFVWFCYSDYDAAIIRMQQLGIYQDLFGLWKDIGLKDENNQTRISYSVWQAWMKRIVIK